MNPPRLHPPKSPLAHDVVVAGQRMAPGTVTRLELPVARLVLGSWMSLPVAVVHGRYPGRRIWLDAAIHGDELNGIEIIRQVLNRLDPKHLRGTVIAVPVVNVFGLVGESRYLPDRRDLNRSFPGSARGSLAARLAHLLMTEVVQQCECGIDFHTGSHHRNNLPQIRCDLDDPETDELAWAFGPPALIHAKERDGSLRAAARQLKKPVLLFEGGEALRFDELAIRQGVEGTLRVLGHLGMITDPPDHPQTDAFVSRSTHWVRARRSGLCRLSVQPGDVVQRGQPLGALGDASRTKGNIVRASREGMVIGMTTNPLVNQGDALLHIAEGR